MNEAEQELLRNFRNLPIPAQAALLRDSTFAVTAWKVAKETVEKKLSTVPEPETISTGNPA